MPFFRFQLSHRTKRRLLEIRQRAFWWLGYPFFLIVSLFRETGQALSRWWSRRNLRFLLQGLPSVVLAIGAMTFAVVVYFQDRNLLASMYQIQAKNSFYYVRQLERAGKDASAQLTMAETCYQRLRSLHPEDQEYRFGLAQVLDAKKEAPATDAVLKKLAALDGTGYGPAHLAMARRLLSSGGGRWPPREVVEAAERHLEWATKWEKETWVRLDAHIELAQICRARNKYKEAEDHLEAAAKVLPTLRLTLAKWLLQRGEKDRAIPQAQAAAGAFRKQLEEGLDNHRARQGLIERSLIISEFDTARDLAQKGIMFARAPEVSAKNPELLTDYARYLLQATLIEYEVREKDPKVTPEQRFTMLESAIRDFPDSLELLQKLVAFHRQEGTEGQKTRTIFRDMLDRGRSSAVAHLVLGMDYWDREKPRDARYHWEKAFELYQGQTTNAAVLVANNLAWVIAHTPPVELDRALGMIEAVLEKAPGESRFRSTRGHILAKLGRHKEALPDLEEAKKAYPDDPKLFRQLAETCANLGMERVAADYKQREDELNEKIRRPQPLGPAPKGESSGPGPQDPTPPPGSNTPNAQDGGKSEPKAPPAANKATPDAKANPPAPAPTAPKGPPAPDPKAKPAAPSKAGSSGSPVPAPKAPQPPAKPGGPG